MKEEEEEEKMKEEEEEEKMKEEEKKEKEKKKKLFKVTQDSALGTMTFVWTLKFSESIRDSRRKLGTFLYLTIVSGHFSSFRLSNSG